MDNDERRQAYNCDITYVTNNELGFDYLRDNMVIYKEQLVQRSLHFAIIDEVEMCIRDRFSYLTLFLFKELWFIFITVLFYHKIKNLQGDKKRGFFCRRVFNSIGSKREI